MMPPDLRGMLESILASLPKEDKKPERPQMQLHKPEAPACPACEMEAEGEKASMPHSDGCSEKEAEDEASNKVVVLLLSGDE